MLAELRAAFGPQDCLIGLDIAKAARSDASRSDGARLSRLSGVEEIDLNRPGFTGRFPVQ